MYNFENNNRDKKTSAGSNSTLLVSDDRTVTDLAGEGCPVQRLNEVCVHLVGSDDDGGHGLLVLRSRGGEEGEGRQGNVVLAAR